MILSTPWWRIGWLVLAGLCVAASLPAAGPVRPAPVTDSAGLLSDSDLSRASEALTTTGRRLGLELTAVFADRLPLGVDLKPYTTTLATQWSIGARQRGGAVLFIYTDDRKIAIRTDSALRSRLSDATCARIIRELGPDARARNWGAVVEIFARTIDQHLTKPHQPPATSTPVERPRAGPAYPAPRHEPSLSAAPVFVIVAGVLLVVCIRIMIGLSRSLSYGGRGYSTIYKQRGWTTGDGGAASDPSAFSRGVVVGSWWSSHTDSSSGSSFGDSGGGGDCSGGGGADGSF